MGARSEIAMGGADVMTFVRSTRPGFPEGLKVRLLFFFSLSLIFLNDDDDLFSNFSRWFLWVGGGPLHLRGTDRSRVLVDTEQVVLVTDDETTHSESKKVLESLRYEGRWKNSSRRGARRAVFSRMHSIELVTSRPLFFVSLPFEGRKMSFESACIRAG